MSLPWSDELSEQVDIFPGHDLWAEVLAHKPVLVIAWYVGVYSPHDALGYVERVARRGDISVVQMAHELLARIASEHYGHRSRGHAFEHGVGDILKYCGREYHFGRTVEIAQYLVVVDTSEPAVRHAQAVKHLGVVKATEEIDSRGGGCLGIVVKYMVEGVNGIVEPL